MKKIDSITQKLQSTSYSYTGKGEFEVIVKNNADKIKKWLSELVPLANQIKELNKQTQKEIKKRNYTRILTKLFKEEYEEFTYMNILIRDSEYIAIARQTNMPLIRQYNMLKEDNKLKYPGRHLKFVDFDIFREFVTLYNIELLQKANRIKKEKENNDTATTNVHKASSNKIMQDKKVVENAIKDNSNKTQEENWTKLLIGK